MNLQITTNDASETKIVDSKPAVPDERPQDREQTDKASKKEKGGK